MYSKVSVLTSKLAFGNEKDEENKKIYRMHETVR